MSQNRGPEPFYSLARSAGDFVFLSAFGPVNEKMEVVGTTIEEQTAACMEAVGRALASEGVGYDDLVCVDVFLTDLEERNAFNAVYAGYFGERKPARRLYGAGSLFKGIKVEVTGIAHRGG
ncbi:RidA family protein [Candidatus Latescibacterota bacterium]